MFLTLNWKDLGKGLILAFLTVFVTTVYAALQAGALPTGAQLGSAALAGLTAMVAYLIKNFFTNSNDQFLSKEK